MKKQVSVVSFVAEEWIQYMPERILFLDACRNCIVAEKLQFICNYEKVTRINNKNTDWGRKGYVTSDFRALLTLQLWSVRGI